jgi:hypothetical protein
MPYDASIPQMREWLLEATQRNERLMKEIRKSLQAFEEIQKSNDIQRIKDIAKSAMDGMILSDKGWAFVRAMTEELDPPYTIIPKKPTKEHPHERRQTHV